MDNYFLRAYFHGSEVSGENDNAAADNVLPVQVYPDIGQAIVDDGKDIEAGHRRRPSPLRRFINDTPRPRAAIASSSYEAEVVGSGNQYALLQ